MATKLKPGLIAFEPLHRAIGMEVMVSGRRYYLC
jgi:hypothetical protein